MQLKTFLLAALPALALADDQPAPTTTCTQTTTLVKTVSLHRMHTVTSVMTPQHNATTTTTSSSSMAMSTPSMNMTSTLLSIPPIKTTALIPATTSAGSVPAPTTKPDSAAGLVQVGGSLVLGVAGFAVAMMM